MNTGDTTWLLICTALVLLMTPGLAFFYGGLVRTTQTVNALVMSFIALGVVGWLWALIGYSLAFSPGSPYIGGLDWVMLNGVGGEPSAVYATTTPHLAFMAFQMMFAVITPALISGAVVGRMKFKAYMVFIALWSLLVYVPLARWVWSDGGWLEAMGVMDFAGGTVVHISAGFSALVAAKIVGPRLATENGTVMIQTNHVKLGDIEVTKGTAYVTSEDRPHNVALTVLGAALLWFGWIGFNAGSALKADGVAALALVNTILAASAAITAWIVADYIHKQRVSAVGASIAAVVGLVAVTPAAGYVSPVHATIIGVVATLTSYYAMKWLAKTDLDDTLDVFACHGLGGVVGALLTGVFADDGNLLTQAFGVLVGATWAMWMTYIILQILRKVMTVRLSPEEQVKGIDHAEHGEKAYNL